MKVFCATFLYLQFGLVIFCEKNIAANADRKIMLMKFTTGVNFINILGAHFAQKNHKVKM